MLFIIQPRLGLCNQIKTIVNAILLGYKYSRDIYIDNFQANCNDENSYCDINTILDLDKMNIILSENNINIKILKTIDDDIKEKIELLENIDYSSIQNILYITDIIEKNSHKQYLNIGNPVSVCVQTTFGSGVGDLYWNLSRNIKFHENFYNLKNKIIDELNLQNYISMHMRIENDAVHFFACCYNLTSSEYNNKLLDFYLKQINENNGQKIYISSSVSYFGNSVNYSFYNDLVKNNNNLYDKTNINIDEYYLKNRELLAIIDLLIAYDGEKFIGSWISSYSQNINNYFLSKGKESILFQP
jgi:hypothetical protein